MYYLVSETMLFGVPVIRGARGRAVQGTAAATCWTELAAFPKHLHLALGALFKRKRWKWWSAQSFNAQVLNYKLVVGLLLGVNSSNKESRGCREQTEWVFRFVFYCCYLLKTFFSSHVSNPIGWRPFFFEANPCKNKIIQIETQKCDPVKLVYTANLVVSSISLCHVPS